MLLEPVLPISSLVVSWFILCLLFRLASRSINYFVKFTQNLERQDDLKKVLFDALLLVEYSFLNLESLGKLPAKHAKRVMVTKLIASHEAIESFRSGFLMYYIIAKQVFSLYKLYMDVLLLCCREQGDQTKTIVYLDAFTNSSLPSLIMKWIRNELGSGFSTSEPTGTSPRAFLSK